MLKKVLKIALWLATAFILFVLSTALLTQMEFVHSYLGRSIAGVIKNRSGVTVQMGRLHGNLWHYLSLDDVVVHDQQDTLLTCRDISLRWSPWALLRGKVAVHHLILEEPKLNLRQLADGSWRLFKFFSSSGSSKPSIWRVQIDTLWMHQGTVTIKTVQTSTAIPERVSDLVLQAQIAISGRHVKVAVQELVARTLHPDLQIVKMHAYVTRQDSLVKIRDFLFKTDHSTVTGEVKFRTGRHQHLEVHLNALPLDGAEVQTVLPWLSLQGKPDVNLHLQNESNDLRLLAEAEQKGERLSLQATLNLERKPMHFDARLELSGVQPATWQPMDNRSLLTGVVHFSGRGWSWSAADWQVKADLRKSRINAFDFNQAAIRCDLTKGAVQADVRATTAWGTAEAGLAVDLNQKTPKWTMEADFHHVNLAKLFAHDTLRSDLNLHCSAFGQGIRQQDLLGQAIVRLSRSTYNRYPLDSLYGHINLNEKAIQVPHLRLHSPVVDVEAQGAWFKNDSLDVVLNGLFREPNYLRDLALADSMHAQGPFQGTITGSADSLILNLHLLLHDIQFNALAADSIRGNFFLSVIPDSLDGRITGRIRGGRVSILGIDSIQVAMHLFADSLHSLAYGFIGDSIRAKAVFNTYWHTRPIQVVFPTMQLHLMDQNWIGGNDSTYILVDKKSYYFKNFNLACDSQRVAMKGLFSWVKAESLMIHWMGVDLSLLNRLYPALPTVQGISSGWLCMTGIADDPYITSQFHVDQGRINGFTFNRFISQMQYQGEKAHWQATLHRDQDNRILLDGYLPVNLSLTNEEEILYPHRPFAASVKAENLDLSFISYLSHRLRQVQGRLDCDLQLTHTLAHPHPAGFLRIHDGQVFMPQTGKKYQDIEVEVDADSSRLRLDKLQIRSGDGRIMGQGSIHYSGSGLQTQLQQLELALQAENFNAVETRDMTLVLNGNLRLSNSFKAPRFDGDITVVRSRLYLPSLTNMGTAASVGEQPMLMTLRQDSSRALTTEASDSVLIKRMQNLNGSIKVKIPRNTWLRSPEMNIEISGEVNVVMSGVEAELFGAIEIMRGDYNLYGRRFEIQEGTITFRGGKELNPMMELKAQHVFRSVDKIKRLLILQVSGELLEPKLTFHLDNSEIAETDAIAYLLFGRNFDELTQGQRTDMAASQPSLNSLPFKELVAGQLAGEVTKAIRNTLDLDVIEFKGDNNWRQATVVLGKYITNDLFVSYQRDFKIGRTYDTTPEQVTMEYEITRALFLQAIRGDEKNTGFDIIWKYEK